MSFPCSECGEHAFPAPTTCYWCRRRAGELTYEAPRKQRKKKPAAPAKKKRRRKKKPPAQGTYLPGLTPAKEVHQFED